MGGEGGGGNLRWEPVGKSHLHPGGGFRYHRAPCTCARVRNVAGQVSSGAVAGRSLLGRAGGRHLRFDLLRPETYLKIEIEISNGSKFQWLQALIFGT